VLNRSPSQHSISHANDICDLAWWRGIPLSNCRHRAQFRLFLLPSAPAECRGSKSAPPRTDLGTSAELSQRMTRFDELRGTGSDRPCADCTLVPGYDRNLLCRSVVDGRRADAAAAPLLRLLILISMVLRLKSIAFVLHRLPLQFSLRPCLTPHIAANRLCGHIAFVFSKPPAYRYILTSSQLPHSGENRRLEKIEPVGTTPA
jgi:hypothetical protein